MTDEQDNVVDFNELRERVIRRFPETLACLAQDEALEQAIFTAP